MPVGTCPCTYLFAFSGGNPPRGGRVGCPPIGLVVKGAGGGTLPLCVPFIQAQARFISFRGKKRRCFIQNTLAAMDPTCNSEHLGWLLGPMRGSNKGAGGCSSNQCQAVATLLQLLSSSLCGMCCAFIIQWYSLGYWPWQCSQYSDLRAQSVHKAHNINCLVCFLLLSFSCTICHKRVFGSQVRPWKASFSLPGNPDSS